MNVKAQHIDDVLVLIIEDRDANLVKSGPFKELVFNEINEGARKIVISFEHVDYLDSSFLGSLVAILKNLLPLEGKLVLVKLNDDIQNLFEMTRLDKIFNLKNSLETALKEF
jgi:anti-sigma B factor antagonist